MPQALSDHAFGDAIGFMDTALANADSFKTKECGQKIIFLTEKAAKNFRLRCYTARTRELRNNKKMFTKEDKAYFVTDYHRLQFIIKEVEHKGQTLWAL
ncbi:hypothetical protein LCGC14_1336950, partial [marine sediment metagenome]